MSPKNKDGKRRLYFLSQSNISVCAVNDIMFRITYPTVRVALFDCLPLSLGARVRYFDSTSTINSVE